jgi:hypothetical protein
MSSAISIKRSAAMNARDKAGLKGRSANQNGRGPASRPQQDGEETPETGFRVWHFFVLLSLIAATLAVIMSRESRPESLILISLTIGAVGSVGVGFYRMLAPLAAADADLATEPLTERLRGDLEREKMLVLRSIKELEFDRAMGKLSSRDFDEMAGRLRSRALGIIKQLDEGGAGYRTLIEKELQARLGTASGARLASPVTQSTVLVAADADEPEAAAIAGACVCGVQNDPDARFCKACGSRL